MNKLFLFRGIPGAGKTTVAETLCEHVVSADDYFTDENGVYTFNSNQLGAAHSECQKNTEAYMQTGVDIGVANTLTRRREIDVYYELAEKYGYTVFSLIVENRHGNASVHDMPNQIISRMKSRFEVKL